MKKGIVLLTMLCAALVGSLAHAGSLRDEANKVIEYFVEMKNAYDQADGGTIGEVDFARQRIDDFFDIVEKFKLKYTITQLDSVLQANNVTYQNLLITAGNAKNKIQGFLDGAVKTAAGLGSGTATTDLKAYLIP